MIMDSRMLPCVAARIGQRGAVVISILACVTQYCEAING